MAKSCPFCGTIVQDDALSCYRCRETLPEPGVILRRDSAAGKKQIRHGILYILLGAVIHYFAGGLSGYELPMEIPSVIATFLTPLLMLGGAGLMLYGIFARVRG
ncbi:MAG: zinc ribbon domain-containing protein [Acidobacteria bacterium]|nr:zinc ribbon domain-containing protein [Acidobacteriota bacterium]